MHTITYQEPKFVCFILVFIFKIGVGPGLLLMKCSFTAFLRLQIYIGKIEMLYIVYII